MEGMERTCGGYAWTASLWTCFYAIHEADCSAPRQLSPETASLELADDLTPPYCLLPARASSQGRSQGSRCLQ